MIKIVAEPIDTAAVLESVQSVTSGAAVLFVGSTRKMTAGRETTKLNYDCYESMAIQKMQELADQARAKWPVDNISVVHRVGTVELGEASIAIAVSSAHRAASFSAAEWLIDEIKKQVPIWKQEFWADGATEWIHPDGATPTSNQATDEARNWHE
jgi:molybdopterin synthase catalytic subunit